MLSIDKKEFLWVEKYRPKNIEDIILPQTLKASIREWIKAGEIPNLLLSGRVPGTGKSSLAHTLIAETGADALFINASLNNSIDLLRTKIQGFASTASFDGAPKIVVLDEADFFPAAGQAALRGVLESFSKNCRFILTCNYPNKILEPIRNRLMCIDLDEVMNNNKPELIKATAVRVMDILSAKNENITSSKEDLVWVIRHFYPSNRLILSKIQQHTVDGTLVINKDELDADSLNNNILKDILGKQFDKLRRNCEKLPDPSGLFLTLYESLDDFPQPLRPQIIITIAKYSAHDSLVRDRLINAVACATEIMEVL